MKLHLYCFACLYEYGYLYMFTCACDSTVNYSDVVINCVKIAAKIVAKLAAVVTDCKDYRQLLFRVSDRCVRQWSTGDNNALRVHM